MATKPSAKQSNDATNFVFRVEGLRLSTADQERISQAIAGAVNAELLKVHKLADPPIIIKPFPWPGGIWIKVLEEGGLFNKVKQLAKSKVDVAIRG
ncbi:MAG TPA: hypothetical protein PLK30_26160 [Blastocatellia bacterium]|nr:hypothetical protein [Blastocatellia bacterium]